MAISFPHVSITWEKNCQKCIPLRGHSNLSGFITFNKCPIETYCKLNAMFMFHVHTLTRKVPMSDLVEVLVAQIEAYQI